MEIRQPLTRKPPVRRNRLLTASAPAPRTMSLLWQKRLVSAVLLVAGVAFGAYVFPFVQHQINQPVARVIVKGDLVYLDKKQLINFVPVYQGDRLLDVNLESVRKNLEAMPWVYSAQVARQWPDAIRIDVVEQKPIAYWNDSKLLNQYGAVFPRQGVVVDHLPMLSGIDGNETTVVQRFLEFTQLLAPLGMNIVRLKQDDQLAWEVDTDTGIHLKLGDDLMLEKMRRFVFLYQTQLKNNPRHVSGVDFRYTSGAAVSWSAASSDLQS